MIKKYFFLLLILILIIVAMVYNFKKTKPLNQPLCKNKDYNIELVLQTGEKGVLSLTDNHCDFSVTRPNNDLSFSVLSNGALKENVYGSRFYFWFRDKNLTVEQQIKSIINKANKDKLCEVSKSDYVQRDGLAAYVVKKDSKMSNSCAFFGDLSDLATEVFMEANDLLILQRQDGLDGIEPFSLASVRFIKN